MVTTSPLAAAARPQLRFGHRFIALGEVSGYRVCRQRVRDRSGSIAIILASTVGALIFAVGVIEHGWRTRFLLGAGVCALIGLSALEDICKAKPIDRYRFDVRLRNGESVTYVTADPAETTRLDEQLRQATS